jgi:cytochrome c
MRILSAFFLMLSILLPSLGWSADFDRDSLAAADYKQGRLAFQQRCSACHTLAEDGSNLIGPNLFGVFDVSAGSNETFAYSAGMQESGLIWTPETVGEFIANPAATVPGTSMMLPEPVPEADRTAMVSFMMLETGGADWPRPEIEEEMLPEGATVAEKFPSFWNHMMNNTTRYRMVTETGEYTFDAYFNKDGSVTTDTKVKGFWHVNDRDFFCYAMYGIPDEPKQFVECFPVVAMSIPRFAEELWQSKPATGVTLYGGIVPGRP